MGSEQSEYRGLSGSGVRRIKRDAFWFWLGLIAGIGTTLFLAAAPYVPSPNLHWADPEGFARREFLTTADDAINRGLLEGITAPQASVQFETVKCLVLVWERPLTAQEQAAAPNGAMFLVGDEGAFAFKDGGLVRPLKLWAAGDPQAPTTGVAVRVGGETRMVKRVQG